MFISGVRGHGRCPSCGPTVPSTGAGPRTPTRSLSAPSTSVHGLSPLEAPLFFAPQAHTPLSPPRQPGSSLHTRSDPPPQPHTAISSEAGLGQKSFAFGGGPAGGAWRPRADSTNAPRKCGGRSRAGCAPRAPSEASRTQRRGAEAHRRGGGPANRVLSILGENSAQLCNTLETPDQVELWKI